MAAASTPPRSLTSAGRFAGSPDSTFEACSCPMQAMGDELGLPRYDPANVLLDDRYFDNLSGQQAYKCFACRVRRGDGA